MGVNWERDYYRRLTLFQVGGRGRGKETYFRVCSLSYLYVSVLNCICFAVPRYIGTVFAVKPKKGSSCRVRVKFDMYPKDKYDKW